MALGWLADTLQVAGMQQFMFKKEFPFPCVAPRAAGSGQEPALLGALCQPGFLQAERSQKRIISDHLMLVI